MKARLAEPAQYVQVLIAAFRDGQTDELRSGRRLVEMGTLRSRTNTQSHPSVLQGSQAAGDDE